MTIGQLCSATGYRSKELKRASDFLAMQMLIDEAGDNYRLKSYLVDLARQWVRHK